MAGIHPRLIPFQYTAGDRAVIILDTEKAYVYSNGQIVAELDTPYSREEANRLYYEQSADVIYLASKDHPPAIIARDLDSSGGVVWSYEVFQINSTLQPPTTLYATTTGTDDTITRKTYTYKVSSRDPSTGEEGPPSISVSVLSWSLGIVKESKWEAEITVSWPAVPGITEYDVYKEQGGAYGYVGTSTETKEIDGETRYYFVDSHLDPDMTLAPKSYENYFDKPGNYPGVVKLHQNSLFWMSTYNDPTKIIRSMSGRDNLYGRSSPLRDDDSIVEIIRMKEVNEIRWAVSLKDLIIGTSGSEFVINAGSQSNALSPTDFYPAPTGYHGSAAIKPIEVNETILFISRNAEVVWSMNFDLQIDNYSGDDITLRAHHIFEGNAITAWAYQRSPYSIVWCVLQDGTLAGLTFSKGVNVVAWHEHGTTNGIYCDAICLDAADGEADDLVVFLMRRSIAGRNVYYIEELAPFMRDQTPFEDSFFLDGAVTYEGTPTNRISGLDHLNGQVVQAFITDTEGRSYKLTGGWDDKGEDPTTYFVLSAATGQNSDSLWDCLVTKNKPSTHANLLYCRSEPRTLGLYDFVISNGTLDWSGTGRPMAVRAVIGLPIDSYIETLPLADNPMLIKAVADCKVKVINTPSFELGKNRKDYNGDFLDYARTMQQCREDNRMFDIYNIFDPEMKPFNGDIRVVTQPDIDTMGSYFIRQREPFPLTALMILTTSDSGEM